jgi:cell division protein FtsW
MRAGKIDRVLLLITLLLILAGFLVFISASLGLLSRDGADFSHVVLKQLAILVGGFVLMFIISKVNYHHWRKLSPLFFLLAIIVTSLVFIPGLGMEFGGAKRWISLPAIPSIQPSEILKLATIMFLAAWLAVRERAGKLIPGLGGFLAITGLTGALLLSQPDTGTFMVIVAASLAVFLFAGGRWLHILTILLIGVLAVATMAYFRPYVRERIITFIDPSHDALGSSYQVTQSMIAIGSGGITGRGFGQSIQKFNYLPEPIGDSIFAVAGEEFGLAGGVTLIGLFLLFCLWGLKIAARTSDPFGRLLAGGIVILITAQAGINIASMLGLIPLTGVPLPFISQGGTALMIVLVQVGVLMNISRRKQRR